MSEVESFRFLWDYSIKTDEFFESVIRAPVDLRKSESGNINDQGDDAPTNARWLTRQNEGFSDFVEAGIRPLVIELVYRHNLMTYSSCEGHFYGMRNEGDFRHIGVFPRDTAERTHILNCFETVCASVNSVSVKAGITLEICVGVVNDSSDNMKAHEAVDLVFYKEDKLSWSTYFDIIDQYTSLARQKFMDMPPISDVGVTDVSHA